VASANAREVTGQTFDGPPSGTTLRFDSELTTFEVNETARTITGTILVYDEVADNGEGRFLFRKGSLRWQKSAVSRVKLLRDHDWGQLLGAATVIRDMGDRVTASFKVARGPAGDQALAEAEDGALDGLSVGLDITDYDPLDNGVFAVNESAMQETSLTPRPAFDNARLTSVTASKTGGKMLCTKCNKTHAADVACSPDTGPAIDYAALAAAMAGNSEFVKLLTPPAPKPGESPDGDEPAGTVNPAARPVPGETFAKGLKGDTSAVPKSVYTFDRSGRFTAGGEHEFSADLIAVQRSGDLRMNVTPEGKRVAAQLAAKFAVVGTDVNELNPTIQRPDMYVDEPAFRRPLWAMVNKGGLPNGVQPFGFPKFATATGLSGDHTEGTEPDSGAFTTTGQTVTPTAISGKASLTREVWEQGGNPAVSNLIWDKMVRSYDEGLEEATATFLATLTAATDIALTTAADGAAAAAELEAALAGLQFTRGYDFSAFAMEEILYLVLAAAVDGMDRPLYPIIGAQNANGTSETRFRRLNISGLVGVPSWALASTADASNSSWLFDPSVIHGWADTPQRLEFAGTDAGGDYAPVAMIDIAVWGHKAFAVTDIDGVRQVTYDETA
jgi:HK97 family phage prohead protease